MPRGPQRSTSAPVHPAQVCRWRRRGVGLFAARSVRSIAVAAGFEQPRLSGMATGPDGGVRTLPKQRRRGMRQGALTLFALFASPGEFPVATAGSALIF
eukprot:2803059-Pyramimonas_sp.AAC.1